MPLPPILRKLKLCSAATGSLSRREREGAAGGGGRVRMIDLTPLACGESTLSRWERA
jgi:hypothetical protein